MNWLQCYKYRQDCSSKRRVKEWFNIKVLLDAREWKEKNELETKYRRDCSSSNILPEEEIISRSKTVAHVIYTYLYLPA